MGHQVCMGAVVQCSFGAASSSLVVLPQNRVTTNFMPAATIMDCIPFVNVLPFGMCTSLANPTVAAATTTALGVLTPMTCVPVIPAPWTPGNPTVLIGGNPILNTTSKCSCAFGGVITVTDAGQQTVLV